MIRSFCVNYCDDIRSEVGNKTSLIGIYGSDLVVPEVPTVLPKLCIFAQIYGEPEKQFDDDIELRVTFDDQLISSNKASPRSAPIKPKQFASLKFTFIMSPFLIEKEGILRVRAYFKGQEHKAGALKIRTVPGAEETKGDGLS